MDTLSIDRNGFETKIVKFIFLQFRLLKCSSVRHEPVIEKLQFQKCSYSRTDFIQQIQRMEPNVQHANSSNLFGLDMKIKF